MKKLFWLVMIAAGFFSGWFFFFLPKQTIKKPLVVPLNSEQRPLISFAVIGDPESDLENLEKALLKIKERQFEFVVIVGDLTQTGTPKEMEAIKKILDKPEIKYYFIPGNHDLWYSRQQNTDLFRRYFGQRYYAREIEGFHFIFLDNADEWQGIYQEQENWLNHYLFQQQDFLDQKIKYLVFSHIPFWDPESKKAMGEYAPALKDQAKALLEKFCQTPPLAIISGHLHKTADLVYNCSQSAGIRMINSGSVNRQRNWQTARFLQLDLYQDSRLEIIEIELEE